MDPSPSPLPDTLPVPLPETLGRYQVAEFLGAGSMGLVVRALDPLLLRQVAIKLLHPDHRARLAVATPFHERIRREALVAASLSHPHIVILFDVGEDDVHGLFLVFALLKGPSLRERLQSGPLPRGEAALLARQMGGALTFAHRAGLVHRDVKPSNISLEPHGAQLADFGIVRLPNSSLTGNHRNLGTPAYAAPESVSAGEFSPKSDQFSLAVTLWEALAGQRLFPGEDAMSVCHAVLTSPIPRLPGRAGVPAEVDTVFARALSRNVAERYETCAAFAEALAAALEGDSFRDPSPTLPAARRTAELTRTRQRALSVGALCGAAAVAAAWATSSLWPSAAPEVAPTGYLAPSPTATSPTATSPTATSPTP